MSFNNLPGVIINTVDGGLVSRTAPTDLSTLIIGTSAQGVVNQPYQVTDRSAAALEFGFSGDLIRSMEEVAAYSDNVILFRMGTKPQVLVNVGKDTTSDATTPGFSVSFTEVSNTSATDYMVWYKAGVMVVWYQGSPVYSNSTGFGLIDTGDLTITGAVTGNVGLQLGTTSAPSLANAISVQAAVALAGTQTNPPPTLTAAVTGIGLTGRQSFVAFRQACEVLEGTQIDQLFVPSATFDAPNVAFYVSSDTTTAANNPATNSNALDWLLTIPGTAPNGGNTYQWASELTDSNGGTTTAMSAVTPSTRIAAGFHEVNWGYDLANFAATTSGYTKTCIALIGTSAPKSFKLVDVRQWIGALPGFAPDGVTPATAGRGLLGNAFLVGTTSAKLNSLCTDFSTGYRLPGFYQNDSNEYDGGANDDINQNPIDIGAYLHVVGDSGVITNGYATNYVNNIVGTVTGYLAALDAASALTNKQLRVTQIPGLVYTPGQLDALTFAKVNMLRISYTNAGATSPSLLHDMTAANAASDYTILLRTRIKGVVVAALLARANSYVGYGSTDGLQLQAMQTALDKDLVDLQTRGYISGATVTINATLAQQKLGHASLYLKFNPANELIQLTAYVGIGS